GFSTKMEMESLCKYLKIKGILINKDDYNIINTKLNTDQFKQYNYIIIKRYVNFINFIINNLLKCFDNTKENKNDKYNYYNLSLEKCKIENKIANYLYSINEDWNNEVPFTYITDYNTIKNFFINNKQYINFINIKNYMMNLYKTSNIK